MLFTSFFTSRSQISNVSSTVERTITASESDDSDNESMDPAHNVLSHSASL